MQVIKKITLAGDGMVGKTSLIRRYVLEQFSDKYIVTIGTKVSKKDLKVKHGGQDIDLTFMIWDIMGLTGYHSQLHKNNFKGAKGALVVADLTRLDTLISLGQWAQQIEDIAGDIPLIFLINKVDLREKAEFTEDDVLEEVKKHNAQHLFTSAKTGENVEKAFSLLAGKMLEQDERGKAEE